MTGWIKVRTMYAPTTAGIVQWYGRLESQVEYIKVRPPVNVCVEGFRSRLNRAGRDGSRRNRLFLKPGRVTILRPDSGSLADSPPFSKHTHTQYTQAKERETPGLGGLACVVPRLCRKVYNYVGPGSPGSPLLQPRPGLQFTFYGHP